MFEWLPNNEQDKISIVREFIETHIKQHLKFPTFGDMRILIPGKIDNSKMLSEILQELKQRKYIQPDGAGWYRLTTKEEKTASSMQRTTPVKKKRTIKPKTQAAKYGVPIYLIQAVMTVIGIGAVVISIYYTTVWLAEFLPIMFAFLLSGIMVGFCISAFETIILFLTGNITDNRFAKLSISAGFILLWLIVTFFSVMSTVAGQYNKHVSNLRSQSQHERMVSHSQWNILQEQKKEIQERIKEQKNQMDILGRVLSGMSDIESRQANNNVWWDTNNRLRNISNGMSKLTDELDQIRAQEKTALEESRKTGTILTDTTTQDIPDFYGWMSRVTGASADKVQFWMSLFPAVFVDIIAPVALAVALFLRKKS